MNPQTIRLLGLPSVPFAERNRLPRCAAIYFVLNTTGTVLYIGQSINLAVRWVAHHRATKLIDKQATRIAWMLIEDEARLDDIESACIAYFDPICNGFDGDISSMKRVNVVIKTDRQVRNHLLGLLKMDGVTMQEFFEKLMQILVTQPERMHDIQTWIAELSTATPPARVYKRRTPTPAP